MTDSAGRHLVQAAMRAPYLAREQEYELAIRWKDQHDQQALHEITTAHMRLVISMAGKFRNYGLPMADLVQEGHVGLLEAASRFEPEREVRFSTYATWWIRASMQDYVLRNWSIVRGGTSSTQKALFFNLRRLRARLSIGGEETGQALYARISATLGVPEADVALMDSRLSGPDASLNAPVTQDSDSSAQRSDFLVSDEPLPDEVAAEAIDLERRADRLKSALGVLNDREMRIIAERRLSEDGATLESLGERLGISKERVRQIETRALEKLRSALLRDGAGTFAPA